jgi:hypothetical protein
MRAYILAAFAAGLLFASEDQKPSPAQQLGQLSNLEKQILEALKNQNAGTLQSLLRDDYVQIAGAGPQRMSKIEVLKTLSRLRITDYSLDDVHLLPLDPNAATLTYKLTLKVLPGEQEYFANPAYVSSTWVRQNNSWLSAFRQWSPLSKEAAGPPPVTAFEAALTPDSGQLANYLAEHHNLLQRRAYLESKGQRLSAVEQKRLRELEFTINLGTFEGVLYRYTGGTKLEDIHATLNIHLRDGSISSQSYWAIWDPGEVKPMNLGFLAFGVGAVQRIELSGTATMAGKRVALTSVALRDVKLPVDWKAVPAPLKLPLEKPAGERK